MAPVMDQEVPFDMHDVDEPTRLYCPSGEQENNRPQHWLLDCMGVHSQNSFTRMRTGVHSEGGAHLYAGAESDGPIDFGDNFRTPERRHVSVVG